MNMVTAAVCLVFGGRRPHQLRPSQKKRDVQIPQQPEESGAPPSKSRKTISPDIADD
jgi:hypothetical protein